MGARAPSALPSRHRLRRVVGVGCLCALLAAACVPEEDPLVVEHVGSLEGVEVTVGSKDSPEQLMLGQLAVRALEALGADVTDRTGMGGTGDVRAALEAGEIDAYYEYMGTAWTDILGRSAVPDSPDDLLEALEEADERNGITWGERAGFEIAGAMVQNEATAQRLGVTTLSELADLSRTDPDAATLCLPEEFATDDDGFPALAEHYEMEISQRNVTLLEEDRVYGEVADEGEDTCNFGWVFATDRRVFQRDLVTLSNDDAYRPWTHPAVTIRTEVDEQHPEVTQLMGEILTALSTEKMQVLDLRAHEERAPIEDIARDWLEEHGIREEGAVRRS